MKNYRVKKHRPAAFVENKIMKFNLLSLSFFFAIATSPVSGNLLLGDMDHQRTLDIDDIEYAHQLSYQAAPADVVNDQNRIEKLADPRQFVPADPVEPIDPVAMIGNPSPDDAQRYNYNWCEDYKRQIGNTYVIKDTSKISGSVKPITGCVAMKVQQMIGSVWVDTDSDQHAVACAGTGVAVVAHWWGKFGTYSVDIIEADGDLYNMQVCWD